jgi:hypothetical protein
VAVLCDTADEPMCIIRLDNILDKTTETYPFNMVIDHTVKAEKLVFQDIDSQSESDKVIGRIDEVVMSEFFNVWNDAESYHLRNFEADCSSHLLSKLLVYGAHAGKMFAVSPAHQGLRLKRSRWTPRRKVLRENAGLKRDYILKANLNNIRLRVTTETGDRFELNVGSLVKDPLDLVDPVVNLVTASNLELLFNTPKNTEDPDRFVPLVLVPKVVLKKNFSMNQASLSPRPGEEPCLTSQPVNGFRLMHQEFQDFIHNYYFLLTVSGLAVHLPYVVQPIT